MSSETTHWEDRVLQWAYDRNLIDGSTPKRQFVKLMEEATELVDGMTSENLDLIKDSIGDVAVVLRIINGQTGTFWDYPGDDYVSPAMSNVAEGLKLVGQAIDHTGGISFYDATAMFLAVLQEIARANGLTMEQCCEQAWSDIKDRTGKMVNGVFVKELA
jgi:hypothetical protein